MKKVLKIIGIIFLIIFLGISILVFKGFLFYKSVFRLSYEQVATSLQETSFECKKFSECKLQPGDILIRRYVTPVTTLLDETLNPYFTHSAFYLGNDEMFEALGNYETPEKQIQITKLSESDWLDGEMVNFVVVRPKNYKGRLEDISKKLKDVANDPEYVFGELKDGQKTASCSDIILKYLIEDEIISDLSDKPKIIMPDYLFFATERDDLDFQIVGYNVNPKIQINN